MKMYLNGHVRLTKTYISLLIHIPLMKTQISLRMYIVGSESLMSAWGNSASVAIQNVSSKNSDQTTQNAQADLKLRWMHMSEGTICEVVAQLPLYQT